MSTTTLLIGLGKGGSALLPYLLAKSDLELVAACDSNPEAVGIAIARQCGLEIYQNAVEAVREVHVDLVVDATGDPSLASTLYEERPAGTSVVTGEASRLLWELLSTHEAQRRSELRFNRLVDDMHSALVVVQDSKVKFINRAFQQLLGYAEKDLLGYPYKNILAEDVQERDLGYHKDRVDGKNPANEYDTKVVDSDGEIREMRVRARRTEWEGRGASLVIMNDVTELRNLQREREQFFRYMVHELRAPLSPLVTITSLLRKPEILDDKDRVQKLIATVARSTDRLQSFVNDYLELSRIQEQHLTLKHEELNVKDIVNDVVDEQKVLADDKGLSFKVEEWDDFSVTGDDFVVRTVVRNLVNNAVKYTQEGSVTVSVDHDTEKFRVHVSDTGSGLTEEEQENIFQEFGRIQRTSGLKGSGLGLALVKKLVDTAGGRISVESEGKDKGSTFIVELPRQFG